MALRVTEWVISAFSFPPLARGDLPAETDAHSIARPQTPLVFSMPGDKEPIIIKGYLLFKLFMPLFYKLKGNNYILIEW